MKISFKNFTNDDLTIYYKWAEKPHVKEKWFRPGYEPKEKILKKIDGKNGTYPFVIEIDKQPVGYIQYYHVSDDYCWEAHKGIGDGVVGFDIFIGEENYVGKGYGSKVVQAFTGKLLAFEGVKKIIVDPFADDTRAIRCYEKAGFNFVKNATDDIGNGIYVMEFCK